MDTLFKIGDRVKITGYTTGENRIGDIGTVCGFWSNSLNELFARVDTGNGRDLSSCHSPVTSLTLEPLVVEEPIFELPKEWMVAVTKENVNDLTTFKRKIEPTSDIADNYKFVSSDGWGRGEMSRIKEITFEQFQEHVLKIPKIVEEIKIVKPLPFFNILRKSRFGLMTVVENNEGNTFLVGDIVVGLSERSKVWGEMRILSFRMTNNNNNVCAVTKESGQWGIGIDKIQHVIKPTINLLDLAVAQCEKAQPHFDKAIEEHNKNTHPLVNSVFDMIKEGSNSCKEVPLKEETLLEKAKRLYPVGTVYKDKNTGSNGCTVNFQNFRHISTNTIYEESGKGCILLDGVWAEIIKDKEPIQITEHSLIREAKSRFPKGTHIKSHHGSVGISNGLTYSVIEFIYICMRQDNNLTGLEVYRNGRWVESLYNGYRVGDDITEFVLICNNNEPCIITKLETIDNIEIIWYGEEKYQRIMVDTIKRRKELKTNTKSNS